MGLISEGNRGTQHFHRGPCSVSCSSSERATLRFECGLKITFRFSGAQWCGNFYLVRPEGCAVFIGQLKWPNNTSLPSAELHQVAPTGGVFHFQFPKTVGRCGDFFSESAEWLDVVFSLFFGLCRDGEFAARWLQRFIIIRGLAQSGANCSTHGVPFKRTSS